MSSGFWDIEENRYQKWNYSDLSMLWIDVEIIDINDNPPRFTKKWFTAGVTKDTQFGEEVLDFTVNIINNQITCYRSVIHCSKYHPGSGRSPP